MSIIKHLQADGVTSFSDLVMTDLVYETVKGSQAYGVATPDSDIDVYGVCVPPKEVIFPHLIGYVPGFGRRPDVFEQERFEGVVDTNNQKYDVLVYNITKFFFLCSGCNPNIVDILFTDLALVHTSSKVGNMMREHRDLFLSQWAFHRYRGLIESQKQKAFANRKIKNEKRASDTKLFGYDVKTAYHVVRMIDELEQILNDHTIIPGRNSETLRAVRAGEWTETEFEEYVGKKDEKLVNAYMVTTLRSEPDEAKLKTLLLDCLEESYGSLQGVVTRT